MGRLLRTKGFVVPAAVLAAKDRAREIVSQADQDLKKAKEEAKSIRSQAAAEGYTEGFREGREAGYAESLEQITAARAYVLAEHARGEEAGVAIGRKMAEKILGRVIELNSEVVKDLVGQALLASRPRMGTVVLRVHPEDYDELASARSDWLAKLPMLTDIRLVEDAAVMRGGCVVETPVGRLDARLSTQLDALEAALSKTFGGKR